MEIDFVGKYRAVGFDNNLKCIEDLKKKKYVSIVVEKMSIDKYEKVI